MNTLLLLLSPVRIFFRPMVRPMVLMLTVSVFSISGLSISGLSAASEVNELSTQTVAMNVPPSARDVPLGLSVDPVILEQAEHDYKAGRFLRASERFGMVAAMNNHPFAWLRIGNIWHRRGNVAMAIDAYARARAAASISPKHQGLWARAVKNMALLGLDQAMRSVQAIGPVGSSDGDAAWLAEVRIRIAELQHTLPAGEVQPENGVDLSFSGSLPGVPASQPILRR